MNKLITIVTATYNSGNELTNLIESLRSQTDQNFKWIVSDGGSTDETVLIINRANDLDVLVDQRRDGGIYDALNRALDLVETEYYLVLGSDDTLYPNAIRDFMDAVSNCAPRPDIVSANIVINGKKIGFRPKLPWLYSQSAYVSSHAVGTIIKKNLHEKFGLYSLKFPIAADQLFLKMAGDSGVDILKCDFVAGEFGTGGVSGQDKVGTLTEFFRIQIQTGEGVLLQTLLFGLRLLKLYLLGRPNSK